MELLERARRYLSRLEEPRRAKNDSQDSHAVVYQAAVILVQGFALDEGSSLTLLSEYCQRSDQPWTDRELHHKIRQAQKANPRERRGWLIGTSAWRPSPSACEKLGAALPKEPKPAYDEAALEKVAAPMGGVVDLVWLANRSWVDPATIDAAGFLASLYDARTEKVVVFSEANREGQPMTQGEAVWPDEPLPDAGLHGVWFLAAPVDGKWRETGEFDKMGQPKLSRRNGACVTSWRWMVLESDEAPPGLWLNALARLPLRIAALYTSGGRSVHALVRTPARTKEEWDVFKAGLKPALVVLGADPGCMSAVRLSRLPGCLRRGKGKRQKLLYLDPRADLRPLCELPALRDVEKAWCELAAGGVADSDETGGRWIEEGLAYYASRSAACRDALGRWREEARRRSEDEAVA